MSTRVQLQLQKPHIERLKRLKKKLACTSYAEVIRRALESYEKLIDSGVVRL